MSKKTSNVAEFNRPHCIVTPASVARAPRARQPTKNFSGLFRGKFPSLKIGRMVHWESLLERDAILLLEFSPGITSFREQPYSIHYFHDGRMRRYTPDFEITFRGGSTKLIEVKPWCKLQSEKEQRRFDAIRSHLNSFGIALVLLDDKQIRKQPLLENLRVLNGNRTPQLSADEAQHFEERLGQVTSPTFNEAVRVLGSERVFWQLVDLEKITVDLAEKIEADTPYATKREKAQNEKIYF